MINRRGILGPGGTIAFLAGSFLAAGSPGQGESLVGYVSRDRIAALAAAADASIASYTPSPIALTSSSLWSIPSISGSSCVPRAPADLKFAAAIGRAVEAAGNAALTARVRRRRRGPLRTGRPHRRETASRRPPK